jgi:Zn-dependent protease
MENLLIVLPVLIFSIVLHEVAHGWVAHRQGDATAAMLGRLTLNPIPHIDPVGSILLPAMLALTGTGMILGWAKPVPVNPRNFRHYKRGDILVSLAGVTVNFLLAFAFAILWAASEWGFRFAPGLVGVWQAVAQMAQYGVYINFALMIFNLIPIPPLDGSHVFAYLLPPRLAVPYRQLGMRGIAVLFILLYIGGFRFLAWPVEMLFTAAVHFKDLLVV